MNNVTRVSAFIVLKALSVLFPIFGYAACIPFDQARNHLDETQCVTGKVIRVQEGDAGVHYLDFCEDYRLCTFTVVVFAHDLRKIGDIRQLAGQMVEIKGEIKDYEDRAEIVLESSKQLNNGLLHLHSLYRRASMCSSEDISAQVTPDVRTAAVLAVKKALRLCPPIFRRT
jgi:hypothetical protein